MLLSRVGTASFRLVRPSVLVHKRACVQRLFGTRAFVAASPASNNQPFKLILYGKPGCHLCEGLEEKVTALLQRAQFLPSVLSQATFEKRDITTRQDWEDAYGLVIPVLSHANADGSDEVKIPRPSPRLTTERLGKHIEDALANAAAVQHLDG